MHGEMTCLRTKVDQTLHQSPITDVMGNAVQAVNLWLSMRDLYGFRKQSFSVGKSIVEILPFGFQKTQGMNINSTQLANASWQKLWSAFIPHRWMLSQQKSWFFVGIIHGSNQIGEVSRSLKTPLKCTDQHCFRTVVLWNFNSAQLL